METKDKTITEHLKLNSTNSGKSISHDQLVKFCIEISEKNGPQKTDSVDLIREFRDGK